MVDFWVKMKTMKEMKTMARRKWLLCRFGGIGDLMMITPCARVIKDRFPDDIVHYAVRGAEQVQILNGNPYVDRAIEIRRFPDPHYGSNCVKHKDGWQTLEHFKAEYDMPIDMVDSIENNSMHRGLIPKVGEWIGTQNSNYQNGVDIALSWCNIDPTTVKEADKRPIYAVRGKERDRAEKLLSAIPKPLVGLHMFASSRARSYFNPQPLIKELLDHIPGCTVIFWGGDSWYAVRPGGSAEIMKRPSLRESVALLEQLTVFVCADSGLSHMAEAVGTKSITIYSTVPAWTRNKYYEGANDIQVEIDCGPCFTLHANCPVNRMRAHQSLSDREQQILHLAQQNQHPQVVASLLNTTPDKIQQEFQAIQQKMDGIASVVPDCIASITPDMISEKVFEVLHPREVSYEQEVDTNS